MAKATRAAQRPAQTAQRSAGTGSKAQQAARSQGRAEPERRETQRVGLRDVGKLPATVKTPSAREVVEYGSAANLPDFMREDAGAGKENIRNEDLETPRLKLMQGTSKELTLYDDLRPSHFFHTAAEHIFDGPFRAVLVYMDTRYILWRPLEDGGGILARSDDSVHWSPSVGTFKVKLDKKDGGHEVEWTVAKTVQQSGLAVWGTMNPKDPKSPPAATLMLNFVLAFPDYPDLMPAAFTFQRSSIKIGRRLNTKLKSVRAPIYGIYWQFSAFEDHNNANQNFFNVSVTGDGLIEDKAEYARYKEMNAMFAEQGLSVKDLEALQGEEGVEEPEANEPSTSGRAGARY